MRRVWMRWPSKPIPAPVRRDLEGRLARHAARRWPGRLSKLLFKYRGAFVRIAGVEGTPGRDGLPTMASYVLAGEIPIEFCRLGWYGDMEGWQYAVFTYRDEKHHVDPSADVTPEHALDRAAGYMLSGPDEVLSVCLSHSSRRL